MKLVKEHIFEKFTQDSDPIHDMGIGMPKIIKTWLDKMGIKEYVINDDLTINVNGTVRLDHKGLSELPKYIQFNKIAGIFTISHNNLTSLRGCPKWVGDSFMCSNNQLTSLKYFPEYVDDNIFCHANKIKFTIEDVNKACKNKNFSEKDINV